MILKLGRWHLSLSLVFSILGFLLATSFTNQQNWGERPGQRTQNLIDFIVKQKQDRQRLGAALENVRAEIETLESERAGSMGILVSYNNELERLRNAAGLTRAFGPGIEILIADAPRVPSGMDPDSFLVHDYDLQIIVNALFRGGAEALTINDERYVASTGIRSAGSTIMVNSKLLGGSFRIKAIGDPVRLERSLKNDADAALLTGEYAQKYGLVFEARKRKNMSLPPFKGSLQLAGEKGDS